ncbi:uncharacterized protein SOCEGT47_071990 [Sorangium cellulosum]|uniref:Uncharacterized protein n=1 Tax=Sorangium cellulosum TaxID=56 RepID=A0A4P2QAL7_SORCE|nr:hypothetical protein [Sorangium cellulosum]AUX26629.1 uncharacterized protein SOCEGT47_071990 [Sorangium cellulosum]
MRRRALDAAVAGIVGCGSAATVCGCYPYDCAEHVACSNPSTPEPVPEDAVGPDAPDTPADPGGVPCGGDPDGTAPGDGCGIFASSSLGDDANPGTRALPGRTMRRAIERARRGARRIHACAEIFPEAVEVPAGTQIRGGFDCARGWVLAGDRARTVLAPGPTRTTIRRSRRRTAVTAGGAAWVRSAEKGAAEAPGARQGTARCGAATAAAAARAATGVTAAVGWVAPPSGSPICWIPQGSSGRSR